MAYQSLYRRYRPQKFSEIRGQEHVVMALRNAVRDDRVGHAYLLSGPRGTGKTTAARILAKVLNCENPVDGEPDGACDSCKSIESGTSFDLHELDAASNNKVDDIRDLLSKVALGTPGRTKVYLLDEVHMLTPGAENALLKTLEEPPDHVVFVLATTEPHKVVDTIRSRTQQLQLSLIPADQMTEMVREIVADAGLSVDDDIIGHVVKVGGGSARDTLSALDQVVAAGGIADIDSSTADLLEALAEGDAAMALRAIETATSMGVDPRRVGERFIDALRSVFLVKMGSTPARMSEPEQDLADRFVDRLTPPTITRSLETVGKALVDMRQAPDPRIDLEVSFVRITQPAASGDLAALSARVETLESQLAGQPGPGSDVVPASTDRTAEQPAPDARPVEPSAAPPKPAASSRPSDAARAALKPRIPDAQPGETTAEPAPPTEKVDQPPEIESAESAVAHADPTTAPAAAVSVGQVQAGWAELLDSQPTRTRNRFRAGSVSALHGNTLTISFENDAMRKRSEPFVSEIEQAVVDSFGAALHISLVTGNGPVAASSAPAASPEPTVAADDEVDVHDLTNAEAGRDTVVDRIADVFPGAEVLTQTENGK